MQSIKSREREEMENPKIIILSQVILYPGENPRIVIHDYVNGSTKSLQLRRVPRLIPSEAKYPIPISPTKIKNK